MNVRIKRLHDAAVIPKYAHDSDSGFDLVAVEDVIVRPGETVRVPTGLAFEIPAGYELQVRPRSGITSKTKLRVVLGTVDSSYRGEVSVIVDNIAQQEYNVFHNDKGGHSIVKDTWGFVKGVSAPPPSEEVPYGADQIPDEACDQLRDTGKYDWYPVGTYIIRKGDRICQGVIVPVVHATFTEVDELGDTERGSGGFGSSGNTEADFERLKQEMFDKYVPYDPKKDSALREFHRRVEEV